MMFNPGQSQSGGLGSALAQGSGVPDDQFARLATQSMQQTGVTPIAMLADLARRITAKKNAMMNQGLQAGAQMARKPATLKDEINQEALALGIGSQPYGYAGGGLVAFGYGGETEEEPLTIEDLLAANLEDIQADEFAGFTPDSIASVTDQLRVEDVPRLNRIRELERQITELQQRSPSNARLPGLITELNALKASAAPAAAAPAAARPSAAPTAAPTAALAAAAARPPAVRPPADTPPAGAPTVPAGIPADIAEYMKAANAGIAGMEGRGKVTPEELQLREALFAAQQAERQQPVEYKEPEGLTTREMLQLASFDPTKGKWMGSLAEKAAGVMSAREAKAEEAKKANREIDAANRKLNTALAQQRLAYSVGDRQTREAADQAVLNARIALREKVIEFGFKSSDTESRRISAEAARAAANRATSNDGTNQQRLAIQRMKADPGYKGVQEALLNAQKAAAAAPTNTALQEKLRKAQADAITLMRRYGVDRGEDPDLPTGAGTAPAERSGWTVQEVK